jgi:D-serine deaminase-like pyridoxal phosphate-dependent protein
MELGDAPSGVDTPAVLVDLDIVEHNVARLFERLRGKVQVRPHLKTAKSAEFARLLLQAGASGVCVAKLSEAEVLAAAGVDDILITTELVGEHKLERLVALLRAGARLRLVVDSRAGADGLEAALGSAGLAVDVLIDVDVGQHRCGVLPGAPARELAAHLAKLPQLRLIGLQGYEGHLQLLADAAERERDCRTALGLLTSTARELRSAGFRIEVVTTGGTGTAEICAGFPGITEVQPGSFLFLDTSYRRTLAPGYGCAVTVLTTVISRPRAGEAVVDAGLKSLSTDSGMAEPKGCPGVSYRAAGDEHGILSWDPSSRSGPQIGDRIELIPSHIDTTVNLHDVYHVLRAGHLAAIWPISARGKIQ